MADWCHQGMLYKIPVLGNYDANKVINIHLILEAFEMQNKLIWHSTITVCMYKDLGIYPPYWVLIIILSYQRTKRQTIIHVCISSTNEQHWGNTLLFSFRDSRWWWHNSGPKPFQPYTSLWCTQAGQTHQVQRSTAQLNQEPRDSFSLWAWRVNMFLKKENSHDL